MMTLAQSSAQPVKSYKVTKILRDHAQTFDFLPLVISRLQIKICSDSKSLGTVIIPQIWLKILIAKTITLSHRFTSGSGLKSGSRYDQDQVWDWDWDRKQDRNRQP